MPCMVCVTLLINEEIAFFNTNQIMVIFDVIMR